MRNEDLLNTPVVKSQLDLWLNEWKLDIDEVLYKLANIHFIVVKEEYLIDFLKKANIYKGHSPRKCMKKEEEAQKEQKEEGRNGN